MTHYLIGGRGRLGQAIAAEFSSSKLNVLDRSVYEKWTHENATPQIEKYFDEKNIENAVVFVASGLLNPNASQDELRKVNFTLPKNIIEATLKKEIKVITFGTVMETLLNSKNPYVLSKKELSRYIEMKVSEVQASVLHIQLHTLFGLGLPSSFMFLGQILASIKNNLPFKMTSGRQLREYHHYQDDASAIRKFASSPAMGVVNLSHGKPLSLSTIAEKVFDSFGKSHLLHVGELPEPPDENYDKKFETDNLIREVRFRDPIPAIVDYMKSCGTASKEILCRS